MLRRRSIGAVLTTALIALASLCAVPAEAAPAGPVAITCGATLHHDAYLAADLTCPTGNGVTAVASLSIDLRGHHLTGSRGGVGITIDYPATVKVTHGRLTGWATGLITVLTKRGLPPVPASVTVIAVTFLDNGTGVNPGDLAGPNSVYPVNYTVYRSWFVGNHDGLGGVVGNVTVKVSGATFRDNQVAVLQQGDATTETGHITVADSELSNGLVGVFCNNSSCDLLGNSFSGNHTAVVTNSYYASVVMTDNTVTGSYIAVQMMRNADSELVGNTFTANRTAVYYDEGGGSVRNNVFSGNRTALRMADAGGEGYQPIPVTGNRVSNNTGDGIVISGGVVQLKDNISTFNHGWGIDAPGEVDQGGNRAFGNYHSPQCVGVVCTH